MSLLTKAKRRWISFLAPKEPAARNLFYLLRKYEQAEIVINYYKAIPVSCCTWCAFPEISRLVDKQERRLKHIESLRRKLNK